MEGVLDETLNRRELQGLSGAVIFDFEKVSRVTSFGVREWVLAQAELQAEYYGFINCHPQVVTQFNIVESFAGRGELLSLYCPYQCPRCDREFEVLIDLRKHFEEAVSGQLAEVICPDDGSVAEFDEVPEHYFAYVSRSPKPSPPAAVQYLLDGKTKPDEQRLSIRKEVFRDVTALKLAGPLDRSVRVKRLFEGMEGFVLIDLAEVSTATAEGLRRFVAAAEAAQAPRLHFAHVPTQLLGLFRESLGNVAVISLLGKVQCTTCQQPFTTPVDSRTMTAMKSGTPETARCPRCQTPYKLSLSESSRQIAAALLSPAPEAIVAYLKDAARRREIRPTTGTGDHVPRYERLQRIGAGGMAEVFLARHLGPHGFRKTVVLKQILPAHAERPQILEMFLQEARIAARISHPNVVQIFELAQEDGEYFIVMEYVDGWNLRTVLQAVAREERPIPVAIACRILIDLCAGLHAAHTTVDERGQALGIVHRDVSPSNVIIEKNGIVKLTDFGIAKVRTSLVDTKPGSLKGKITYMAPEQVQGDESDIGPHTDMFAVGIILVECLTGRRPFGGVTEYDIMTSILNDPIPSVRALRPDAPMSMDAIVRRALARDPLRRYRDASELSLELEQVLLELETPATSREVASWVRSLTHITHPSVSESSGSMRSVSPAAGELAEITVVDPHRVLSDAMEEELDTDVDRVAPRKGKGSPRSDRT